MAAKLNLVELVETMPATDRELEAAKTPPATEQADAQKPKPQNSSGGSKFTGPDPNVANPMCEEVLAGGRAALLELIGLIRDPAEADFKNYKAEYLLHCLTVYVGRPEQETQRRMFIDALMAQVGSETLPLYVRGFLVRELYWIGDRRSVPALGKLLGDEQLGDDAARALVAIGEGAAEQFRKALPNATGRRRLVLVQSLGAVRDAPSVPALQTALADGDREVRLAAAWGLARIGDAGSVDLMLKAASVEATWERIKATQSCLVLAENLAASGKKNDALKIYTHLRNTRTDPKERYVRDAAAKALAALGGNML